MSAVLLLVCAPVLAGQAASGSALQARSTAPDPTVGPLFPDGIGNDHTCTASVLAVGADLLLTAAHCITGTGAGMLFVPGYDGTATDPEPYGVWQVGKAWVDPAWSSTGSASADFAILRVAPHGNADRPVDLRSVTGGNTIGGPAQPGMAVTVPAYAIGNGDAPFACTVSVYQDEGSPAFDCEGYPGGTSGAPWLTGAGTADRRADGGRGHRRAAAGRLPHGHLVLAHLGAGVDRPAAAGTVRPARRHGDPGAGFGLLTPRACGVRAATMCDVRGAGCGVRSLCRGPRRRRFTPTSRSACVVC